MQSIGVGPVARRFDDARKELSRLQQRLPQHVLVAHLAAVLAHDEGHLDASIAAWKDALARRPDARALHYGYVETLLEAGQAQTALDFLSQRLQITHGDDYLYELQARAYAALHKELLQHRAQAEAYVNRGNISAAVDQLQIALRSPDGDFYSLSSTEARLKELRAILDYDRLQKASGRRG